MCFSLFCFNEKAAYEMRISAWSSDVCSSDLNRLGSFQWTWETKHAADFLGVPAAGKITKTRGVTVMGWDENGKIVLERSIWDAVPVFQQLGVIPRSEEHTSELQSLMRISYAVFCLKKKIQSIQINSQKS